MADRPPSRRAMDDHSGGAELVGELTDFTFALRLAGLDVTIDRSMSFLRAVAGLDSVDPVQLFWAGRSTLCIEPGDFDIYDDTFNWFFRRDVPPQLRRGAGRRPTIRLASAASDHGELEPGESVGRPELSASQPTQLRHQDLAELSDDERAELSALLRLLDPASPVRRAANRAPGRPTSLDQHRTIRSVLRGGGVAAAPKHRPRRLVLLIDTSASMAPFAEPLLTFAHAARRRLGNSCEVFSLGAALTRLSEVLAERDAQHALDAAVSSMPSWSGGTRLGQALQAFLDQHGQRGMARGAVVIVFSDGGERDSVELLCSQARRLSRLTRTFIWVNPHSGADGFAPAHSGIVAVQPFCDHLLAGHSLPALGELMDIAHEA